MPEARKSSSFFRRLHHGGHGRRGVAVFAALVSFPLSYGGREAAIALGLSQDGRGVASILRNGLRLIPLG